MPPRYAPRGRQAALASPSRPLAARGSKVAPKIGSARADGAIDAREFLTTMAVMLHPSDVEAQAAELIERLLREDLPIGVTAAELEAWMARPLRARRHWR